MSTAKTRDDEAEAVNLIAARVKTDPVLRAKWIEYLTAGDEDEDSALEREMAAEASTVVVQVAIDRMRDALAGLTPAEREAAILEVYEPMPDEVAPAPSTGPKLRADAEANVQRVVAIVRRLGPGSVERRAIADDLGVSLQAANKHVRNAILTGRLIALTKSLVALPELGRAS